MLVAAPGPAAAVPVARAHPRAVTLPPEAAAGRPRAPPFESRESAILRSRVRRSPCRARPPPAASIAQASSPVVTQMVRTAWVSIASVGRAADTADELDQSAARRLFEAIFPRVQSERMELTCVLRQRRPTRQAGRSGPASSPASLPMSRADMRELACSWQTRRRASVSGKTHGIDSSSSVRIAHRFHAHSASPTHRIVRLELADGLGNLRAQPDDVNEHVHC